MTMQLTVWTYEGPPHVGAMRVATGMQGLHYVLHAPQGDTYADLLFTMIERRDRRPPVTYTTFSARDLGGDTAELFKTAARNAYQRFQPQAMIVGASCTGSLIQDDPGGLARALELPIPVVTVDLPAYQRKENWGAAETFYQLVRALAGPSAPPPGTKRPARSAGVRPRCNLLGATALGFRHRDDVAEITGLLSLLGIDVNVTAPMGGTPADLKRLGDADFNVVLYPEIAGGLLAAADIRPAVDQIHSDRCFGHARIHRRSGEPRRRRSDGRARGMLDAVAMVFALGRLDLSDRQAGLHLRRRDARRGRRPHRFR
jgi:light-independent protochlorophyllide reductase subunit B